MEIAILIIFSQRSNQNDLLNGKMKRLPNGFNFHLISQEIIYFKFLQKTLSTFFL